MPFGIGGPMGGGAMGGAMGGPMAAGGFGFRFPGQQSQGGCVLLVSNLNEDVSDYWALAGG